MYRLIAFVASFVIFIHGIHSQEVEEKELFGQIWKKVHAYQEPSIGESIQEWIPKNQDINNFQEMVVISRYNLARLANSPQTAIEFVDVLKNQTFASYKKNTVSWNPIRSKKNDVIFEWKLSKKYRGTEPEHNLSRVILNKNFLIQIIYTKKNAEIDSNMRDNWINWIENLLKNQPKKVKSMLANTK